MPDLDESAVDALLRQADIGAAPGRGAKLAPGLNAQLATVAKLAKSLPFDCEAPGFALALARRGFGLALARQRGPRDADRR